MLCVGALFFGSHIRSRSGDLGTITKDGRLPILPLGEELKILLAGLDSSNFTGKDHELYIRSEEGERLTQDTHPKLARRFTVDQWDAYIAKGCRLYGYLFDTIAQMDQSMTGPPTNWPPGSSQAVWQYTTLEEDGWAWTDESRDVTWLLPRSFSTWNEGTQLPIDNVLVQILNQPNQLMAPNGPYRAVQWKHQNPYTETAADGSKHDYQVSRLFGVTVEDKADVVTADWCGLQEHIQHRRRPDHSMGHLRPCIPDQKTGGTTSTTDRQLSYT